MKSAPRRLQICTRLPCLRARIRKPSCCSGRRVQAPISARPTIRPGSHSSLGLCARQANQRRVHPPLQRPFTPWPRQARSSHRVQNGPPPALRATDNRRQTHRRSSEPGSQEPRIELDPHPHVHASPRKGFADPFRHLVVGWGRRSGSWNRTIPPGRTKREIVRSNAAGSAGNRAHSGQWRGRNVGKRHGGGWA